MVNDVGNENGRLKGKIIFITKDYEKENDHFIEILESLNLLLNEREIKNLQLIYEICSLKNNLKEIEE